MFPAIYKRRDIAGAMEIGIKITWSSYTPPVPYLRLLAALRRHSIYIAVPVFTQE